MKKITLALLVACLALGSCSTHKNHSNDRDYRDGREYPGQFDPSRHPDFDMNRPPIGHEFDKVKGLRPIVVGGQQLFESNGVYYRQVNRGGSVRYRVVGYREDSSKSQNHRHHNRH